MGKYNSRKLILCGLSIVLLFAIPLIYRHYGISDSITTFVLGGVSAITGMYGGLNLYEKKKIDKSG